MPDNSKKNLPAGPIFESGPGWGEKLNKWLKKNASSKLLPAIAILVLLTGIFSVLKNKTGQEKLTLNLGSIEGTPGVIVEIAQPRDGYSVLARRALARHLETADISLTPGRKLFVEESLRQIVETDPLKIGQEVKFLINDISGAISDSKELTASQIQKWESWAETVDFNK